MQERNGREKEKSNFLKWSTTKKEVKNRIPIEIWFSWFRQLRRLGMGKQQTILCAQNLPNYCRLVKTNFSNENICFCLFSFDWDHKQNQSNWVRNFCYLCWPKKQTRNWFEKKQKIVLKTVLIHTNRLQSTQIRFWFSFNKRKYQIKKIQQKKINNKKSTTKIVFLVKIKQWRCFTTLNSEYMKAMWVQTNVENSITKWSSKIVNWTVWSTLTSAIDGKCKKLQLNFDRSVCLCYFI